MLTFIEHFVCASSVLSALPCTCCHLFLKQQLSKVGLESFSNLSTVTQLVSRKQSLPPNQTAEHWTLHSDITSVVLTWPTPPLELLQEVSGDDFVSYTDWEGVTFAWLTLGDQIFSKVWRRLALGLAHFPSVLKNLIVTKQACFTCKHKVYFAWFWHILFFLGVQLTVYIKNCCRLFF